MIQQADRQCHLHKVQLQPLSPSPSCFFLRIPVLHITTLSLSLATKRCLCYSPQLQGVVQSFRLWFSDLRLDIAIGCIREKFRSKVWAIVQTVLGSHILALSWLFKWNWDCNHPSSPIIDCAQPSSFLLINHLSADEDFVYINRRV